MSAGTAYSKRYGAGFVDLPTQTTPVDQQFLNAVETALLQLLGAAPTVDGQVAQWDNVNTRYGPALLLNKNIDPAAAIAKSKLDLAGANGIVDADVAGAAAIARSKLNFGAGLVNADIAAAAAIAKSKLAALAITDADVAAGAAIATSKLAIIMGGFTSAGVKSAGSGFTVARNSAGNYTVTWSVAFASTPIVLAIPNQNSGANPAAFIANPGTASVQIVTHVGGVATDTPVMFLAMLLL